MDRINDKFGLFTVYPANLLGRELIRPEVTGFLGDKYYQLGQKSLGSCPVPRLQEFYRLGITPNHKT